MSKQFVSAVIVAGCGLGAVVAQADVEVAPNTTVGSQVFFDSAPSEVGVFARWVF